MSCLLHHPITCLFPIILWIQNLQQSTICTNPLGKVSLLSIFLLPIELSLGYFSLHYSVHVSIVGLLLVCPKTKSKIGRRR